MSATAKQDQTAEEGLMRGDQERRKRSSRWPSKRKLKIIILVIVLALVALLVLALALGLNLRKSRDKGPVVGAVAADHPACSDVGRDILAKGGSAVDAAIAALLCDGVRQPHSMGIGGGCFLLVYNKNPRKVEFFNGREYAPLAATPDKYINQSFVYGPLSIAVPPEVQSYWEAHQRYGSLPWKTLFEPAIKMARDGHPLSESAERALKFLTKKYNTTINARFPQLCKYFCHKDGEMMAAGDTVKLPELAETLKGLAEKGPDYMYKGPVAKKLLKDIKDLGGLITQADFDKERVRIETPMEFQYNNLTMYVPGAPSGGPVMGLILKVLEGFNLTHKDIETVEAEAATYHKIVETFKFSYADRFKLGDPRFVNLGQLLKKMATPEYATFIRKNIDLTRTHDTSYYTDITEKPWDEQGTAHINVLGPNGDAVSVTSTVNYYFGSLLVSPSTGIILNNEMTDFDVPDASVLKNPKTMPPNYIQPGKQPRSSMAPAIFVDSQGDPVLILGSSGGSRITTVNAQVAARIIWFKQSIEEAVRHKRFHHQLFPNKLIWEPGFSQEVLEKLKNKYGHELKQRSSYMAVLQAIQQDPDTHKISAFSDERKHGKASLLYQSDLSS